MFEFFRAGGPVMFFLVLTSIAGVTFIIERGLALRWRKVIPVEVEEAVERCAADSSEGAETVERVCKAHPSPVSNLLLLARAHLDWPKQENSDSVETRGRHDVMKRERGLVTLEISGGIVPQTGMVG